MNIGLKIGVEKAKQAMDHASDEWKKNAYDAFVKHAKTHKTFTTEQVRLSSIDKVGLPPDSRAWGGIALIAKKNSIVVNDGLIHSVDKNKHGIPVTLWKSLVARKS